MKMNEILVLIGSLVMTLVIMSMPVLLACSFIYHWHSFIRFITTLLTIGFFTMLWEFIFKEADK